MAKNTTTTPTALAGSALSIIEVDPASLGVDDQVRADATPDDGLVESVKRFGVLQPPTVYWDEAREQHIVVIGHRRVGAAITAKLPKIQVLVRDAAEAQDALRLEQQLVENERREALTPADVARGYKDLSLFGMRPEDIAVAVADRPERVTAALKATKSEPATAALAKGIDFEQAAMIAEFDDHPTLQADLTRAAVDRPQSFLGEYTHAKNRAAAAVKQAELEEQLRAEDCPLVGVHPWTELYWSGNGDDVPYSQGRALERLELDRDAHTTCPGHGAIIDDANNPQRISIRYVCTDWKAHHEEPSTDAQSPTPEQIERQQELERLREEARLREAAFEANTLARRDWLRGFITGRLNQTAGIFDLIAAGLIGAADLDQVSHLDAQKEAIYILTGETPQVSYQDDPPLAEMIKTGRFTALRALVAAALGVCENSATTPSAARSYAPRVVAQYFEHLATWGYELTDLDIEIRDAALEGVAELELDTDDEGDDETDEDAA